ncbi:MAG: isoamylase early set domain-containing protein [Caldilineaceae bacterium]|nr:isoamylase early set domain-containing protein [Caldilineaceae bacterium]
MIQKQSSPCPGHVRVSFELPSCLWADRIFLVGDFNDWDEKATPMYQARDGVWRAVVDLPVGQHYQFRYIIDGQWKTDYNADGFAQGSYGTDNSVVYAELPVTVMEEKGALVQDSLPTRQRPTQTEYLVKFPAYDVRENNRKRTPKPVRVAA